MIPVLTRAEVRELDRRATAEAGVASLDLMERAGRGAAAVLLERFPKAARVAVVCGRGNNGGDGFVVARVLGERGREARVLLCGDPGRLHGDARVNFRAWADAGGAVDVLEEHGLEALDAALASADVVVDALFGTGLDRELAGFMRAVVERLNAAGRPIVALDLPSGIDADTGAPLGVAVRAAATATFARSKRGLSTPRGAEHAGDVTVVAIGIPAEVEARVGCGSALLESADVARAITPRGPLSHKGSSGRVLILAGSPGKIGAALLVTEGALRAGAGLVTLAAEPSTASVFEQRVLEAMTTRLDPDAPERSLAPWLERVDVVALGPGLGLEAFARRVVEHVALDWTGRVVADADALTLLAGRLGELKKAPGRLVLTPHPGEMARLLERSSAANVEADRFGAVRQAAETSGQTVLLKGSSTLIAAPGELTAINPTGTPLLATGGAGDVLTGVIAALLVGSTPFAAACAGAYVHGAAARRLGVERGVERGVLAHEVAGAVPRAIAAVLGGPAPAAASH